MYQAHPDLRLCEGDWKVDVLATEDYPAWYRTRKEHLSIVNVVICKRSSRPAVAKVE
jgi:hypothetical protein